MKLLRSIVPFLLLLLSFVGTAQTVQNDTSSGDSVLLGTELAGEWQRDTTFYNERMTDKICSGILCTYIMICITIIVLFHVLCTL
ncbi:MAG: hypothetical protein J5588_05295 [Bacteroidales bacterium]|nr:hypothetical protein [Bacteroidales bacterium]